jgi:hypothetical protein
MPYTAQTLITRSWYLSGIVSRGLQTVGGAQINDGLYLLNALLDWEAVDTTLIPYWTYFEFPAVTNQESYFIPNLYDVESLTFNIDVVRYSTQYVPRSAYFGTSRVDNVASLPFSWYFNRGVGGGTIYMYFLPSGNFPIKIMGKFALQDVTLQQDMSLTYDTAYIEYLRYALANYMCSEYSINFNPQSQKRLDSMRRTLMYVSPPDLSVRKSSILVQGTGINWGDVNIGRGWRPA